MCLGLSVLELGVALMLVITGSGTQTQCSVVQGHLTSISGSVIISVSRKVSVSLFHEQFLLNATLHKFTILTLPQKV